mgnify:CR=1 FL=1
MSLCPHCKKPLNIGITKKQLEYAKKLRKEGHSLRNIEKIFFSEGIKVSFATLSRKLR